MKIHEIQPRSAIATQSVCIRQFTESPVGTAVTGGVGGLHLVVGENHHKNKNDARFCVSTKRQLVGPFSALLDSHYYYYYYIYKHICYYYFYYDDYYYYYYYCYYYDYFFYYDYYNNYYYYYFYYYYFYYSYYYYYYYYN